MDVKAKVLCDNTVYRPDAMAEHGWAVWLETADGNYLFDTGQGRVLRHNTTFFGLDLATARAILISHHHYDHTGGLLEALRLRRGRAGETDVPVHAHFDLFKESYAVPKGRKPRYVGVPFSRLALEGAGAIFRLGNEWQEIAEGLYLTGEVPRRTDFEPGPTNLKYFNADRELVDDPLLDDQSLVVETRKGLLVVLGCSHAGIVNILTYVAEKTGRSHFHTVIGGTHLGPAREEQVTRTVEALQAFDIERFGAAHCTGPQAAARLARAFGDRFLYCHVGTEIEV
jgi:7,8-dihydropterin-6-yl-methyl-4-(beta-D-ribofuranosyl)aminobenzene 5'-phosphate synthase